MRCASCCGDVVRHQLRIELGALDLLDVDADFLAGQLRELVTQLVDFRALLPDDDAGTARVDRHDDLARLPLDRDVRDRRMARGAPSGTCAAARPPRSSAGQLAARRTSVELHCLRDAEAEADRIGLSVPLSSLPSRPTTISHVARPLLNRSRASLRGGHEPLELRPLVHDRVLDVQRVHVERRRCCARRLLGVRHRARFSVFSICFAACFFENLSSASASFTSLPRIWSITRRILYGDCRVAALERARRVGQRERALGAERPGEPPACGATAGGASERLRRHWSALTSLPDAAGLLVPPCPPVCPRNSRVGENSPSLWPTMFSVT